MLRRLQLTLALLLLTLPLRAAIQPDWTRAIPPFRIAGNLYYVGSADLASYLIVTPAGNILINSDLETSPPLIRHSVEQLGFKWSDTKILLISHAHYDHDAGSAQILRETRAKYMVMDADVPAVEHGGRGTFEPTFPTYPPAHVSRVLHDGDTVTLGGSTLVAHKTAGHTPGCTTWTMRVNDHGRILNGVIVGSVSLNPGTDLLHNKLYPTIAADFEQSFRILNALPVDLFLGAHGIYYNMLEKRTRISNKPNAPNPFVDPAGYHAFLDKTHAAFEAELTKQRSASHP